MSSGTRREGTIAGFVPLIWSLLLLLTASCSDAPKEQTVSGTIETDETHIASRYGGRVQKIHADEGDVLKTGQLLIELDAEELRARRAQSAAVLSELIAGPRPQEIESAKSEWESQQAQLQLAEIDRKRALALFAQSAISPSERDQFVNRVDILTKSVAAAKSRYDLLLAGTRPERIDQGRGELASLDAQIKEMQLIAPTDSVLEVLSVKVGDVLAANQEAATLILPQHLWVRVYVPETWLGFMKLGDTVPVRVDSFPDKDFSGVIEQIAREAEFTPRNVQTTAERVKQVYGIKVRLDPKTDLRAGMAADVSFPRVPKNLK